MLVYSNNPNIYFSKGTWLFEDKQATCYASGANFIFTTDALTKGNKTITLHLDLPNVMVGYEPILAININNIHWSYTRASSEINITLPAGTNNCTENPLMANLPFHYIEIWVRTTSNEKPRWTFGESKNINVMVLKSIEMDDSSNLYETKLNSLTMLAMGSSSTEGIGAVGYEYGRMPSADVTCAYGTLLGKTLGLNTASVGYGATGLNATGEGNAPNIFSYYKYMDNGILRNWNGIDVVVLNIGANDSAGSTEFINLNYSLVNELKAVNPDMKIIMTSPFQTGTRISEYAIMSDHYKNDPLVFFVTTNFQPILQGHHSTISNYLRWEMPYLRDKLRPLIFKLETETKIVNIPSIENEPNININVFNDYERLSIKKN